MAVRLAAVDRIDVEGRVPRAVRHDRHDRPPRAERRQQLVLEALEHGAHVADRRIAQERHRAVRGTPAGLELGPPDAAVADADPVDVERFGDDHVVDRGRENQPRSARYATPP